MVHVQDAKNAVVPAQPHPTLRGSRRGRPFGTVHLHLFDPLRVAALDGIQRRHAVSVSVLLVFGVLVVAAVALVLLILFAATSLAGLVYSLMDRVEPTVSSFVYTAIATLVPCFV